MTAAPQGHVFTISEAITRDHKELNGIYSNIMAATDADTKERWRNQFAWELARHAVAEELVVYPAMEAHLPDGKDLTARDRAAHQLAKEDLYKFQSMSASDSQFEPLLSKMITELREHMRDEQEEDMPKLEKVLPELESQGLAKSFERTKMFVPSRSHPSAPDKPPFETVAAMLAAPIDHISDLFRKFPEEKPTSSL